MGKVSEYLSGGAAYIKRYKVAANVATAGIPLLNNADGGAGVANGTTTSAANAIGLSLDAATYSTTQGDTEGIVTVDIRPDAVVRMRMSNSATSGTALVVTTNSSANSAGTTVTITTGDPVPNSPDFDEGAIACVSGANVGHWRKITSNSATTAVVTVPFPNTIASGDVFILVPWMEVDVVGNNIQLTSDLLEARQDIATGTGAEFRILALEWDFSSQTNAQNNSYVSAQFDDHIFKDAS